MTNGETEKAEVMDLVLEESSIEETDSGTDELVLEFSNEIEVFESGLEELPDIDSAGIDDGHEKVQDKSVALSEVREMESEQDLSEAVSGFEEDLPETQPEEVSKADDSEGAFLAEFIESQSSEESFDDEEPDYEGLPQDDGLDYLVIGMEAEPEYSTEEPEEISVSGGTSSEELLDPIFLQINNLAEKIDQLSADFDSKLKYDGHKEKIIDRLHRELQEYKDDLLKKYMKSMIMDIIKVIDDLRKLGSHYRSKELTEEDSPRLMEILENLPSDLEDLFYRQDVKSFTCESDQFDPGRQRVVQKVETDDQAKNKMIAERLLPGYEWDGQVMRPEMVAVYVYRDVAQDE